MPKTAYRFKQKKEQEESILFKEEYETKKPEVSESESEEYVDSERDSDSDGPEEQSLQVCGHELFNDL